ncbi:urease accessory protein UreE [Paralcaligenes sp. KSB-10]|uniref:urease accessory protein UreE n=1 Tax=Paralcaligenes sp. KSB-10 TaxID=2901142 RepID=UPI001E3D8CFB|nr:urease accessory protein UreE [Paralcaligenes sp. KSB-10]UHL63553.1 urease accessory protein UreE [Paralcaligenes sp. KSB-10]
MRLIKKYLRGVTVAKALTRHAPTVILPFEARRRSRQKITLDTGEEVGLLLERGTVLRNGDMLVADDGKFILVQAAQETVLRVTAKTPTQLTRAAYHLGNRHILVEIGPGYLQLEHDPVLVDMLRHLGDISVETIEHVFEPDAGAYGGGHKHGHDETFEEDYALAQAAYTAREATNDHGHSHSHSHHHHKHE